MKNNFKQNYQSNYEQYYIRYLLRKLGPKKRLFFLKRLGYPNKYDMKDYIDFLVQKITNGEIPPELGVFLGYPLKDVRGFMGFTGFKLTKISITR